MRLSAQLDGDNPQGNPESSWTSQASAFLLDTADSVRQAWELAPSLSVHPIEQLRAIFDDEENEALAWL